MEKYFVKSIKQGETIVSPNSAGEIELPAASVTGTVNVLQKINETGDGLVDSSITEIPDLVKIVKPTEIDSLEIDKSGLKFKNLKHQKSTTTTIDISSYVENFNNVLNVDNDLFYTDRSTNGSNKLYKIPNFLINQNTTPELFATLSAPGETAYVETLKFIDNKLYVVTWDKLLIYNLSGTLLNSYNLSSIGNTADFVIDSFGNYYLYCVSTANVPIIKITPTGTITTLATISANFGLYGIEIDNLDNIYVLRNGAPSQIIKINSVTGTFDIFAEIQNWSTGLFMTKDNNLISFGGNNRNLLIKTTLAGVVSTLYEFPSTEYYIRKIIQNVVGEYFVLVIASGITNIFKIDDLGSAKNLVSLENLIFPDQRGVIDFCYCSDKTFAAIDINMKYIYQFNIKQAKFLTLDEEGNIVKHDEEISLNIIENKINEVFQSIPEVYGMITKSIGEISSLIFTSGLIPGSMYEITGVNPTLYQDKYQNKLINLTGTANPGSGYVDGSYQNIPLLGGTGSGVTIDIEIQDGNLSSRGIAHFGVGYTIGDVLTIDNIHLGGTGSGLSITLDADCFGFVPVGDGTTIYLQALTKNKLASNGYGKFYNPKYNQTIDGFGIWDNKGTWITEQLFSNILGTTNAQPMGMVIDSDNNIYTANYASNNVTKITPDGVSSIHGTTASGPYEICIDSDNNVYTANYDSNNVTKITPDGVSSIHGTTASGPTGICIDNDNNIYTANFNSNNVTKITPAGVSSIYGTTGSSPRNIVIDSNNNIYTINNQSNNVSKIIPDGTSSILGSTATPYPSNLAVDSVDNIYISDFNNDTVTKITPDGTTTIFGTTGLNPRGIISDSVGNIYTANSGSNNVTKITPAGVSSILGTTGTEPYDLIIDSFDAIYVVNRLSNNVTKIAEPISFVDNEDIISDNGATGTLIGNLENNKFIGTSGNWDTSTSITGQTSGAKANISNINIYQPVIGDKIIWGGYSWTNDNGNVGNSISQFELNSDWTKNVYTQENYNIVYDPIEYDYENDFISSRYELKANNKIYMNFAYSEDMGQNAIASFMWGNNFNYSDYIGIGDIIVENGVFENINFSGNYQRLIKLEPGSKQDSCTFQHGSYQENITFGIGAFQQDINFEENAYQENILFDINAWQSSIIFEQNSYQNNINFGIGSFQTTFNLKQNSKQQYLTFEQSCSQQNITLNSSAYQERLIFKTGSLQNGATLGIASIQKDIVFGFGSSHETFTIPDGLSMRNILIEPNVNINVPDYSAATLVFEQFFKTISFRPNATKVIKYYNNSDVLVFAEITD